MMRNIIGLLYLFVVLFSGCAAQTPPDYTLLREYRPRSILVIPPLNESTDI